MTRVLIVDDEPLARAGLRRLLERHDDMEIVGEAEDGHAAIADIERLDPDLVFLDVQIPQLDGFGVVDVIGADRMPPVVFVTAFDEFAVRAFEVHAIDYIVKPVSDDRFDAMLDRVRRRLAEEQALELTRRLGGLLANVEPPSHAPGAAAAAPAGASAAGSSFNPRMLVDAGDRSVVVQTSDIAWIEAEDYHVAIHVGGERYRVRDTLAALEARLDPARFVRIHRSAIVNLDRVREIARAKLGHSEVVLQDGTRLPISRRRREQIESMLGRD